MSEEEVTETHGAVDRKCSKCKRCVEAMSDHTGVPAQWTTSRNNPLNKLATSPCCCCRNFPPVYTGAYIYIYIYIHSIECPKPGVLDRTRGPHTAHYVQLRHFIYFSPSSASTEGEYGILEPKFHDGGHCQSVLRRQCVLLLPPSTSG